MSQPAAGQNVRRSRQGNRWLFKGVRLRPATFRLVGLAATSWCALVAAGCGDDTTSAAGGDLSIVQDLAGGVAPTCAAYCDKIQLNCIAGDGGGSAQYPGTSDCINHCMTAAAWPAGRSGDTSGNSIGCRLYHAGAAAADPLLHCPHAGPTGGNVCGTWCENYCQLMAKNCTGSSSVYDAPTCMTRCATIPTNGHANDPAGDSVQCRIYHLGVAASDPATQCPNAKTKLDLPGGSCT